MRLQKYLLSLGLICSVFVVVLADQNNITKNPMPKYLDWSSVNLNDLSHYKFPKDFLFGVAIAEYQNSGAQHVPSNWSEWEKGEDHIKEAQTSGKSCDHRARYKEDLVMTKDLGLNSFRFDINWALCEPEQGKWDESAFTYYHDKIDCMIKLGIKPMVTLHHFVHPIWFENLGGFENEENIAHFVRFAEKMFDQFHDKVELWSTFNEPNTTVQGGWLRGVFPPGKQDVQLAGQVYVNLAKAHIQTYQALKKRPGGDKAKIGIVFQYLIFEPFHEEEGVARSIESAPTWYLTHVMTEAFFEFLKTGKFHFEARPLVNTMMFGGFSLSNLNPVKQEIEYEAPNADTWKASDYMDWVGLNYYSHVLFDCTSPTKPAFRENDIPTDMWYAIYGEGMYHSIVAMSELGVPMYVTENGMADNDDSRRAICIQRNLYALSRALKDGYDVRGYYYWTLMDNFEWDEGHLVLYGLYDANRKLKEGAKTYAAIVRNALGTLKILDTVSDMSLPVGNAALSIA